MQNLISRKDAAEILGISVKTLDQARLNGLIAYVQFVENGCVYFTETAIDEYIANAPTGQSHLRRHAPRIESEGANKNRRTLNGKTETAPSGLRNRADKGENLF